MVCRVGKAPLACQLSGMGPLSWLEEMSMLVMLVRLEGQPVGRHPVRLLPLTYTQSCNSAHSHFM